MLTFLLGPFFAILPKHWRNSLPFAKSIVWNQATAISGLVEFAIGLIALSQWYGRAMSTWVGHGVSQALDGKIGPEVRVQDIGGAALIVWAMHPLTWLLGYFAVEGAVRFCAGAFSGTPCGTFPLYLVDVISVRPFRRRSASPMEAGAGARANVSSFVGAVHQRIHAGKVREVPDELCFSRSNSDEILEVHSCRRKQDWTPPRVVRYLDSYYRLEESGNGSSVRPFLYRLRRLAAGVPSRTLLLYAPADALIRKGTP